jgi:predicted nucleic acid-binding protein
MRRPGRSNTDDAATLSAICPIFLYTAIRTMSCCRGVWELRHNLTAGAAVYVALAEVLDARLLTCDRRLATAAGHRARVDLA